MNYANSSQFKQSHRQGFSLVEMLVVISIMAILLGAGAVGIRNMSVGKGSDVGLALAESMFNEARSTALGRGTFARLCITNESRNDLSEDDIYRSRMFVAYYYEEPRDASSPSDGTLRKEWVVDGRALSFPQGTYFSERFSKENFSTDGGGDAISSTTMNVHVVNRDGKIGRRLDDLSTNVYYYEFNSEGILTDGSVVTPDDANIPEALREGASFVLGTGIRNRSTDDPPIIGGDKDLKGFMIWKRGETSRFRRIDQITTAENIGEF